MPDEIKIEMPGPKPQTVAGSCGLNSHLPGQCITVDAIGGGIGTGIGNLSQIATDGQKK